MRNAVLWMILLALVGLVFVYGWPFLKRRAARREFGGRDREVWAKRWQQVESLLGGGETHLRVALIDADKMLDYILKAMHMSGEDTGQRLKFLAHSRPELRYIYEARRLRNKMVHEATFVANERELKRAVLLYKKIFRDLGVID